jgi:hypothetical protein
VGVAVALVFVALAVTAPGRGDPDRTRPATPPAASPDPTDGPGNQAAAARRGAGQPQVHPEENPAGHRSDPPFEPAAEPLPGVTTPRVAHLRLGGFDKPAAGVQARAGVPKGIPVDRDLRRNRSVRTLTIRKADTDPFSAVGVTWLGDEKAPVSVALRHHVPGKGWSGWQSADAGTADRDPHGPPRPGPPRTGRDPAAADRREPAPAWRRGTDLVWLGAADGIQVSVTGHRGRGVADIVVDLIDPRTAPGDEAAGAAGTTQPGPMGPFAAPPPAPGDGRVPMPAIAHRGDWGADERLMAWSPEYAGPVKAVAFHHTATANSYQPVDVPRILRAIYYFQAVSRGWGDIGYTALVDRFGRLWEGRYGGLSRPVVGAHAGGFNRYTAGIAVIGDFRSVAVPSSAVDAAARYVAWKLSLGPAVDPRGGVRLAGGGSTSRHPVNTSVLVPRIFPHGLTNRTQCPAARGLDALGRLREQAYRRMGIWAEPSTLRARLATWRPSDATWRVLGGSNGGGAPGAPALAGAVGDVPAAADFDGDGTADPATWSPLTGIWQIRNSGGGTAEQRTLGVAGDRPVPADYNGDGRAEPAVWRPTDGTWLFGPGPPVQWGEPGDVPVPADYDGDGSVDLAVWRPSTGTWYVRGGGTFRLGENYHIPLPADYDGDGDADPGAWSPATQRWFVWGKEPERFGEPGDVPVPGQYDGDGVADLAVWRPGAGGPGGDEGTWFIKDRGSFGFGQPGDVAIVLP